MFYINAGCFAVVLALVAIATLVLVYDRTEK